MKKKLAALLCGILCACLLAAPVYAQGVPEIDTTEGGVDGGEVIVAGMEPVSVTEGSADGMTTITKVYELPQGADTAALTAPFERDGVLFSLHDISQRVQQGQADSRTAAQTETLESESGKVSDIIAQAAPTLAYSADGYTGQLTLDKNAITVVENGTDSYSYRVEDVREYTNLDRNDAAYVPKTVLKNGVTLQLENIEWVVMGTTPADGRLVPNLFTAVATYAGKATGSKATGYTATLTYSGTVTKNIPGTVVYTVVFCGEPVAAASEAERGETAPAGDAPRGKTFWGGIVMVGAIVLFAGACLAVAGVRIARRIRAKRGNGGAADFDLGEEDYTTEDGYSEPTTECSAADAEQEPPRQAYPQDEFNIDELFNEEGLFNE